MNVIYNKLINNKYTFYEYRKNIYYKDQINKNNNFYKNNFFRTINTYNKVGIRTSFMCSKS